MNKSYWSCKIVNQKSDRLIGIWNSNLCINISFKSYVHVVILYKVLIGRIEQFWTPENIDTLQNLTNLIY